MRFRMAGKVERCHAIPTQGSYTVGQHSYDALGLLLCLYPGEPSITLVKAMLWHDSTEQWLGDLPSPTKMQIEGIRELYEGMENELLEKVLRVPTSDALTEEENKWLRACDLLELYLFCQDQEMVGNQWTRPIKNVCRLLLQNADLPIEVREFITTGPSARYETLMSICKEMYGE